MFGKPLRLAQNFFLSHFKISFNHSVCQKRKKVTGDKEESVLTLSPVTLKL
jgi:hypothetical protein